jgi:hypothetical protein
MLPLAQSAFAIEKSYSTRGMSPTNQTFYVPCGASNEPSLDTNLSDVPHRSAFAA